MHTSLDSIVNLSVKVLIGQLTAYLLNFGPDLTFGKYDVAVLKTISILGIILLAAGWVMEVAVLFRDNI